MENAITFMSNWTKNLRKHLNKPWSNYHQQNKDEIMSYQVKTCCAQSWYGCCTTQLAVILPLYWFIIFIQLHTVWQLQHEHIIYGFLEDEIKLIFCTSLRHFHRTIALPIWKAGKGFVRRSLAKEARLLTHSSPRLSAARSTNLLIISSRLFFNMWET